MRAVIIGGGLGGLATALRLRKLGHDVAVLERSGRFGGKMNLIEADGFRFDTGPSLITMPWVFRDLFEHIGAELEDLVELDRVEEPTHYVFADGTTIDYGAGLPGLTDSIRELEPRDVAGFYRFMELGSRLYDVSSATFFARPMGARPDLGELPALRRAPLRRGWGRYSRTVEHYFRSPYLRQLYNRYPTYVGSSPYRSPATLAVIPYLEFAFGVWYVRGGLYRLVESMVRVAEAKGIELQANAEVVNIERLNGAVRSVALADGRTVAADIVVMNGDTANLPELLGRSGSTPPRSQDRALSGFVMLLGISSRLEGAPHHSVYFSSDYESEFTQLFDGRRFPDDPTVYACIPSTRDRSLVPPGGGEVLFLMANAPPNPGPWDDANIAEARRRVLAKLASGGFPDLSKSIVHESVWTPRRMAHAYGGPDGSIYGTNSHGWRRAFLRPSNRVRGVRGLYRVGGSAHPGGGTPMVLLSAKIVADLVSEDFHV